MRLHQGEQLRGREGGTAHPSQYKPSPPPTSSLAGQGSVSVSILYSLRPLWFNPALPRPSAKLSRTSIRTSSLRPRPLCATLAPPLLQLCRTGHRIGSIIYGLRPLWFNPTLPPPTATLSRTPIRTSSLRPRPLYATERLK